MNSFWERWLAQPPEVQGALIGLGGAIIAAVVAGGFLLRQVRKQAQDTLKQSRTNEANRLKLQIYEQIIRDHENVQVQNTEFQTLLRSYATDMVVVRGQRSIGLNAELPRIRFQDFVELQSKVSLAALRIITLVERWEIVEPRVRVFQFAVNSAMFDFARVVNDAVPLLVRSLPLMPPKGGSPIWSMPTEKEQVEVEAALKAISDAVDIFALYAADFRTEMQLALLGDVFPERQITRRTPLDPRFVAIRLEQWREQISYFENETPWGREMRVAIDRATIEFAEEPDESEEAERRTLKQRLSLYLHARPDNQD